jgi:hypothetical protein
MADLTNQSLILGGVMVVMVVATAIKLTKRGLLLNIDEALYDGWKEGVLHRKF